MQDKLANFFRKNRVPLIIAGIAVLLFTLITAIAGGFKERKSCDEWADESMSTSDDLVNGEDQQLLEAGCAILENESAFEHDYNTDSMTEDEFVDAQVEAQQWLSDYFFGN